MKFSSLRDILRFAISKEETSVQFYRTLAGRVHKPDAIAVFNALAEQEEEHIESVKLELLKLGYTVSDTDLSDDKSAITLEMDKQLEDMGFLDALRLGVQKERAAFRLYVKMLSMAEDTESQNMFMELAEEEMRHLLHLEHEVELLSRPHTE